MAFTRWLGALTVAGAFAFAAEPASAEPATAGSIQLGIGFRYGWELTEDYDGPNPWGPGVGVNGGFTLALIPVYLGGVAEFFFGESKDRVFSTPAGLIQSELSARLWQLQAEGGYDIGLGPIFVVRPKLGLGYAQTSFDGGAGTDDSTGAFALAPGVTALLFLPVLNVQADVRYDLVFTDPTQKGLLLSIGIGF